MSLTTPEAQAGAYEWAAVLLAHGFIGLAMAAKLAAIETYFGSLIGRTI